MALFKRNANESAYVGGKKHFVDVIKNTGPGDMLVWRQPEEDFNDRSTLIVMPGEEAVFINKGVILEAFESGTYTLSTDNYPFISRIINAFSGGISAFNCVVYFVKKSLSTEVMWGTDSPIQVRDKKLGIATKLKARGAYKVCVDDAERFITKMLGSNVPYQTARDLNDYFFNEFQSKIRTVIAKACNEQEEELLGIDARLEELSASISPFFNELLAEYGLKCISFTVSAIDIDDNELRARYDAIGMNMYEQSRQGDVTAANTIKQGQAEAQVAVMHGEADVKIKIQQGLADAQIMIAKGKAEKEIMETMGEAGWSRQQVAEILKTLAANEGSGAIASVGAGLGMGMAAAGPFANLANQVISPVSSLSASQSAVSAERDDPVKRLTQLKELMDAGLINEDEYNAKKKEILARI